MNLAVCRIACAREFQLTPLATGSVYGSCTIEMKAYIAFLASVDDGNRSHMDMTKSGL